MKKFIGNFQHALLTEELFDSIPELSYTIPDHPNVLTDVIINPAADGVEIDFPENLTAKVEAVLAKHNPGGQTKAEREAEKAKAQREKIRKKLKLSVEELNELLEK